MPANADPLHSLKQFGDEANRRRRELDLSKQDEWELARRIQAEITPKERNRNGNVDPDCLDLTSKSKAWHEARRNLVEANLPFCLYLARKPANGDDDLQMDLVSVLTEELLRAALNFDPEIAADASGDGIGFVQFLSGKALFRRMILEKERLTETLSVSDSQRECNRRVRKLYRRLAREGEGAPCLEDVQAELPDDVTRARTKEAFDYQHVESASLDEEVYPGQMLREVVRGDDDPDRKHEAVAVRELLEQQIDMVLTKREARILRLYVGLTGTGARSLKEIADHYDFDVSKERIRQLKNEAVEKLRNDPDAGSLLRELWATWEAP